MSIQKSNEFQATDKKGKKRIVMSEIVMRVVPLQIF